MKLAISNIAWVDEVESDVAKSLQVLNVANIEIAPTKYWQDPTIITWEEARRKVDWWGRSGISVVAFQSMLFNRPDLTLFESKHVRRETIEYLKRFLRLAGWMGAHKLVFGSPKNRQRKGMSLQKATDIAVTVFEELAVEARSNDVVLCLEPNAPAYNCDFITNAREGAELVRRVGDAGFQLHLDTACMALSGDDFTSSIIDSGDILSHFHASSPMLATVERRDDVDHVAAAAALKSINYDDLVSIEMKPEETKGTIQRVERSVEFIRSIYDS